MGRADDIYSLPKDLPVPEDDGAAAHLSGSHLPYPLLSDSEFKLCDALRLPWFETSGMRLLKRLTWVVRDGCIERVFYSVFPPDRNAAAVLTWIRTC